MTALTMVALFALGLPILAVLIALALDGWRR